jgi:hypothetical protein
VQAEKEVQVARRWRATRAGPRRIEDVSLDGGFRHHGRIRRWQAARKEASSDEESEILKALSAAGEG